MGVSERVRREDVVAQARKHYLRCERIDMQSLASELGIGRTTLYRWVGDRESLIAEVISEAATDLIEETAEDAEGSGLDWVVDGMGRFMEVSSRYEPLRHLVQSEPELGLRVMMAPGSRVSRAIVAGLARQLRQARPQWPVEKCDELADVMTQIGMAYEWGNIATRSEPDLDRAVRAMEALVRAADA